MDTMLKDSLQNIQIHKVMSPHYTELLEILEEILILREEYRHRIKREIFPVEQKLIAAKLAGGLPLVDFSSVACDLTEPRDYFLALLEIAEKRSPGETGEMSRRIRENEISFNDLIYESFNPLPLEEESEVEKKEENSFDLIELFIEESLRPALEKVVEVYGDVVGKAGWSEGYCPICG
ncbi:MAG TPA: formate dehydrogenase accessory protein FdhE, partial [bacterium]|nr:formate dehydrogenase accessory protein FdhE [bacterium]